LTAAQVFAWKGEGENDNLPLLFLSRIIWLPLISVLLALNVSKTKLAQLSLLTTWWAQPLPALEASTAITASTLLSQVHFSSKDTYSGCWSNPLFSHP